MGLDLSNVQLPIEDATKPAELDNLNPAGDEPAEHEEATPTPELPQDDQGGLTAKLGPDEGESQESFAQPATPPVEKKEEVVTPPAETPEVKPEEKVETPTPDETDKDFHKHPDWIKREEKLKQAELDLAFEKGKVEALASKDTSTTEKKEEVKSAAQIAEEVVREKHKSGWVPKDELELNRVYNEEFEKALDAKQAAREKTEQEQRDTMEDRRKEILAELETVYTEFGITSEDEKEKAANLAMSWAKDGTANWSIKTLRLATEHLKAKGEIGKAPVVTPPPTPPADPNPAPAPAPAAPVVDQQADTNRRISRLSNGGVPDGGEKRRSISTLRRESLDDIVARNSEALDGKPQG